MKRRAIVLWEFHERKCHSWCAVCFVLPMGMLPRMTYTPRYAVLLVLHVFLHKTFSHKGMSTTSLTASLHGSDSRRRRVHSPQSCSTRCKWTSTRNSCSVLSVMSYHGSCCHRRRYSYSVRVSTPLRWSPIHYTTLSHSPLHVRIQWFMTFYEAILPRSAPTSVQGVKWQQQQHRTVLPFSSSRCLPPECIAFTSRTRVSRVPKLPLDTCESAL